VAVAQRYYPAWFLFLCLALTGGCAQLAVRPPTPARELDPYDRWEPPPGERFYITLFASQTSPRIPRLSHSWGTVLHVVDQGEGRPPLVESHTISWLPATLEIHPWNFHTEKAINLDLQETLRFVLANGEHVSQWGPYECRPNLYYRFLVQKEFLESGRIGYQCVDTVGESARTGNGCDCIHAMTDMDPLLSRNHYPLIRYGDSATRFVVQECRRRDVLINPGQTHAWLNAYLGLDSYPIVHRD
jgi:hypothetical protein